MDKARPDLSQLIPPLPTNTQGVRRLLSAYRSGTAEIQNLLSQECNVILECKICQNMFRSLPNFISHKRAYCLRPAPPLERILHNNQLPEYFSNIEAIENELGRRDIDQIASRLSKKATFAGSEGIRGENPEAEQNAAYYTAIADTLKSRRSARIEQTTILTPIPGTSKAVSQTIQSGVSEDEEMTTEHEPPNKKSKGRKGEEKIPAGKNGNKNTKSPNTTPNKGEKKKDGTYTVMQYPCPLCKKVFSKPNGTYRHIREIHKKNNDQLERMKNNIRKKSFLVTVAKKSPRAQTPPVVSSTTNNNSAPKVHTPQMVQEPTQLSRAQKEEEKEWNDHTFTVDVGDHRCAYCGMRYERRAALLSHAKQCNKKSKEASKKSETKTHLKSKGAANRKMSAPMKIVRKYLMNGSKGEDDRIRKGNGVKSPVKNIRSTRSSGNVDSCSEQKDQSKKKGGANMFPTIPLTRLRIASGERVVINSSPLPKVDPPKPPIPVAPLQSAIELENIIKSQKSIASNILVRQVSDKTCLSPVKTTSPVKEPPTVASITPMLSVKPKDGYPLNYFSPGSAETKLIGGNSVPSSIQIRRDYTKTSISGDESVDGSLAPPPGQSEKADPIDTTSQPANPVIASPEVPKSTPLLENKQQTASAVKNKETVEPVKIVEKEKEKSKTPEKVAEKQQVKSTKPDIEIIPVETKTSLPLSVKSTPKPVSPNNDSTDEIKIIAEYHKPGKNDDPTKSAGQPTTVLAQRLKNSTIVAVPVSSWNKIPNIASAIKLSISSDLLLANAPRVYVKTTKKANTPQASPGVTVLKKYIETGEIPVASNSSNNESKSASKEQSAAPTASTHVPEVSKPVPTGDLSKRLADLSQVAVKILPKVTAKHSVPSSSKKSITRKASEVIRLIGPPKMSDEHLDDDQEFRGWSTKHPAKSLARHSDSVYFNFCKRFEQFVNKPEERKIVIELEPSDQSIMFPPNVKIEYLDD